MAIGAIIGLVSTIFQVVRAFSPPETTQSQTADRLFARLDEMGRGEIGSAELRAAFDRIGTQATGNTERLFSKLDADGDGKITRSEFSGSIARLAEELDRHYMRLRLHGERAMPAAGEAAFTREELGALAATLAGNFDKADADGDGRLSIGEAKAFVKGSGGEAIRTAAAENVELMLQVVRLMQAYGIVQGSGAPAGANDDGRAAPKISVMG
jgi:Ca2+-binding EF-hand superfamily protein